MPHTDMKTAAHWPALETELLIWVTERQQHGVVVSTTELRLKAIHLSKQAPNCQQFCVSVDWWYDFLRRHQLSICHRTHISTETTCWLWQADSISVIDNKHYKILTVWSSQISNTDQTPLTFDLPSETTIPPKESKSVSICATGKKKYNIELVQIFRWKFIFELVQYTNVHTFCTLISQLLFLVDQ